MKNQPIYRTIGSCSIEIPGPWGLVIFGASGDLTKRKIIPALFRLHKNLFLPKNFFVLGTSRTAMSDDQFREKMHAAVKETSPVEWDDVSWKDFSSKIYYTSIDYASQENYQHELKEKIAQLEKRYQTGGNRTFYLALPPTLYETVVIRLGEAGLAQTETGYTHAVLEKPIGRDLHSAKQINQILRKSFQEDQIYRIDHYLALETVQNMLMFRFANSIFEPLWNRRYIDHVQISAAEKIGIEQRAGYYERAGVLRDMFQNHMFQLLTLTAMEPPVAFGAEPVRDEKVKVFRSIRSLPLDEINHFIAIGQYGRGEIDGKRVPAYRDEPGVSQDSTTPTFAAMKVFIDNWRWHGVPFYLRSGKRLSQRKTEISIHFRPVPFLMFQHTLDIPIEPNTLVLRVQPAEGMSLILQAKNPGSEVCLQSVSMDFAYRKDILMDAYEWVLLNCMHDDQLLFVREDGVEQAWGLLTPIIETLESTTPVDKFPNYTAGSAGPKDAALLIERDGRRWRPL